MKNQSKENGVLRLRLFMVIFIRCDSLPFILKHKISASEINLHTWVGLFPLLFQAPWPWNDADFPSLMASELRDRIQLTLKTCPLSYSVRKYYLEFAFIFNFLITYWKISFVRIGMDFRRSITFVTVPSATIDVIRTIQSTSTCPTIGYIRISENKKKHREITKWIIFGFQFNEKKYQKLTLNRKKLSKIKVEKIR